MNNETTIPDSPVYRRVTRVVKAAAMMEGAGVRIHRTLGSVTLPDVDPFLLLDEIDSSDPAAYLAGFPSHPHRGLETVTYMLAGSMKHLDSSGGKGTISEGDVQWVTTGRGILHSEMPSKKDGAMHGFQLWLNMPAAEKMTAPRYIELKSTDIPEVNFSGGRVRVISGALCGRLGPAPPRMSEPSILDVTVEAGGEISLKIDDDYVALAYVFEGVADFGHAQAAMNVSAKALAVLSNRGCLVVASESGARMLVIAGRPLGEPIARHGPFVMNTQAELQQAFADFQADRFT